MSDSARRPSRERARQAREEYPAFRQMVDDSARLAHESAERWRNGLAAIVAIALGSLILKGPDDAQSISSWWRVGLTVAVGAGVLLAIAGLWLALRAAAGTPGHITFAEVLDDHGTVREFRVSEAHRASRSLARARWCALAALVLLISAQLTAWWAPLTEEQQQSGPTVVICTPAGAVAGCQPIVQHTQPARP